MFKITDNIEFNRNRAECPVCLADGKSGNKNLALIPNTDGAYKCHRGCTSDDIRNAIGQPKNEFSGDRIVPTALAKPTKAVTHTAFQVCEYHHNLISKSQKAIAYLASKGITKEAIIRHQLGIIEKSARNGKDWEKHWCIAIPYEISENVYMNKYRVNPWMADRPKDLQKWSQDNGLQSRFHFTKKTNQEKLFIVAGDWDAILLADIAIKENHPFDICTNTTGEGGIPTDLSAIDSYKEIFIFYDLDKKGLEGAPAMAKAIGDRAKICTVPHKENYAEGYDSSNAIADGFTFADFVDATKKAIAPGPTKTDKKSTLKSRLSTTAELMARAKDYTDWLIDEILPINELILLAASPRAGKSLMAMNIAQCVASGSNFLDRPVTQGTVIYVQCEDSETKTKQRAIAQGWDENLPVYWLDKFKLSELPELIELAKELEPRLIVLDTLSRIRDDNATESSAEMGRVLEPLQEFAKNFNCCILPIHHTGKIKADNADTLDVFETIRGSSAIRATCRGTLVIAANETGYRLCIENGYNKQDLKVSLNLTDLTWKLLGKWGIQVDSSQNDQVLDFLVRHEHATLEQIHDFTGISKASLYKVLSRLVHDNKVSKIGSRKAVTYSKLSLKSPFIQSDIPDMSDTLSDSENQTPQSDEAYLTKNNFTYIPDTTQLQKHADDVSENTSNLSDCQTSTSNQLMATVSESDKLSDKPKSVRNKALKVGDRVRIKSPHFLSGQEGIIDRFCGDDAILTNDRWAVSPSVPIKLLERAK